MSQLFNAIAQFYKGKLPELSIFDLSILCADCSMSISTGKQIEASHFDGYMNRKMQIPVTDRTDAAECLLLLSQLLVERLKNLNPNEVEVLDRHQRLMSQLTASVQQELRGEP